MNQVRPRRGDPLHPPVPLGEGGGVPRVTSVRCVAVPHPLCLGTPRWVGSLLEGVPRGVVGSEGDLGRGSGRVRSAGKWGGGGPSRAALLRPADVSPHSPSVVAAQGLTPPLLLRDRQWLNHELMSGEGPGGCVCGGGRRPRLLCPNAAGPAEG